MKFIDANGSEIEVLEVDSKYVTYKVSSQIKTHADFYCTEKDSFQTMLKVNGYQLV